MNITKERLENEQTAELCRACGYRIRFSAESQYCKPCLLKGMSEETYRE